MSIAQALRLCPDAMCVPVPGKACSAKSREIRRVLERFAPIVAGASIDEWYLDMGGTEGVYHEEPLSRTAHRIRDAVHQETTLPVSIGGGTAPRWKRDGRELYYLAADNRSIMAVPIEPGATFKPGPPARLFSLGTQAISRGRARATPYDVSPDGQRFLFGVPAGEQSSSLITVVLNWTTGLKP